MPCNVQENENEADTIKKIESSETFDYHYITNLIFVISDSLSLTPLATTLLSQQGNERRILPKITTTRLLIIRSYQYSKRVLCRKHIIFRDMPENSVKMGAFLIGILGSEA
jgi:hypothetical protein